MAGRDGQRDGEHGFADAGRPEQSDVGPGAGTTSSVARSRTLRASRPGWKAKSKSSNVSWAAARTASRRCGTGGPPAVRPLPLTAVDEVEAADLRGLGTLDELGMAR